MCIDGCLQHVHRDKFTNMTLVVIFIYVFASCQRKIEQIFQYFWSVARFRINSVILVKIKISLHTNQNIWILYLIKADHAWNLCLEPIRVKSLSEYFFHLYCFNFWFGSKLALNLLNFLKMISFKIFLPFHCSSLQLT